MRKGLENHKTAAIIIWVFFAAMLCYDTYNYLAAKILPDLFAVILYAALVLMGIFSTVSAVSENKAKKKIEEERLD